MTKPVIGITKPVDGNRLSWLCIRLGVWLAGGNGQVLTPQNYQTQFESIDGLVIAGGTDIHPRHYGDEPKPDYQYDDLRDAMEFTLFEHVVKTHKPVLGICRGAQLINIARGGSLHLDISKVYEKAEYPNGTLARIFYRKPMNTQTNSLLFRLIGCNDCKVNSIHTQGVDRLGKNLTVTAKEPNGVVQAIEDPQSLFLLGVQFHPEYMLYANRHRNIFKGLIEAARTLREKTG